MNSESRQSLLEFPCDFPIKAMGEASFGFDALVVAIIREHVPDLSEGAVSVRESRNGKYLSVTVTIRAISQTQLDQIYIALSGHEKVLMAL